MSIEKKELTKEEIREDLSKLPIHDLLLYNPYDKNNNNYRELTEEHFKEIRILPQEYEDLKVNLLNNITPTHPNHSHFYVLSGYSGNGKTTFLNWFKEEVSEQYFFHITNLISEGYHGNRNDVTLFESYFRLRLSKLLKDKVALGVIVDNEDVFLIYFLGKLNLISQAFHEDDLSKEDLLVLLEKLDFRQLLIIFLLHYVHEFVNNEDLKSKTSYTFCFDNLDEFKFEYLTPKMWQDILDVSDNMNQIIQDLGLDFNFRNKITFLLVFREANIACGTAQQHEAIIGQLSDNKRFVYTHMGKEIIQKRLECISKNEREGSKYLRGLLNIISKEKITDNILLPLFNYDYRELLKATIAISGKTEVIGGKEYRHFTTTEKEYNSFDSSLIFGKRGILVHAYLKYFVKNDFLHNLAPQRQLNIETPHCNKARLMLTVFSNLSFPGGFSRNEDILRELEPRAFGLKKGYLACKKFISISDFFSILKSLIDINKSSWAHLITVYGKDPSVDTGNIYSFNFTKEAELLEKYVDNKYALNNEEREQLDKIELSLNASAYIYLRHILVHFEYISVYKTRPKHESVYSCKPLFFLTDITYNEKGVLIWEFEKKIEDVFKHIQAYTKNTEKFLTSRFKYTKSEYCESDYVFKGAFQDNTENINKGYSLYMTRVITTHIRYLETFRHYIIQQGFKTLERKMASMDRLLVNNIKLKTKESISGFIIKYINCCVLLSSLFFDTN